MIWGIYRNNRTLSVRPHSFQNREWIIARFRMSFWAHSLFCHDSSCKPTDRLNFFKTNELKNPLFSPWALTDSTYLLLRWEKPESLGILGFLLSSMAWIHKEGEEGQASIFIEGLYVQELCKMLILILRPRLGMILNLMHTHSYGGILTYPKKPVPESLIH